MNSNLFSAFFNRRILTIFLLGFSSGIPLALTGTTLQAWMKTENVDLTTIGLFSLVGWPYTVKYLWAPLLDRFTLPFLGRRQGWILFFQILLLVSIAAMGTINPAQYPWFAALLALGVAFFSASQDIVVDAYRTDVLEVDEIGPGASLYVTGYRIAMLVSGAVALMLADRLPWRLVYFIMALTMLIGIITSYFAPQPRVVVTPPTSLRDAVVLPFFDFFKRTGAFEILLFVVLYKIDVTVVTALTTPFMMELGFTKTDIGLVTKGFGLVATIVGTLVGGTAMVKLGMKKSLWTFGITQAIAGLSFLMLARLGHHYPMMVFAIAAENFCSGMGNAAYSGFMMSLCNKRFTATQFALLTSIMAITRVLGASPSGYLAKAMGWEWYFIFGTVISIPSLLLLLRYDRWIQPLALDSAPSKENT